jgi:hypothetical protein
MFRTGFKGQLLTFFPDEKTVVWSVPRTILRVGAGIVWETAKTHVSSNGRKIPPRGMDNVEYSLHVQILNEFLD